MKHYLAAALLCVSQSIAAQSYDSIIGDSLSLGVPNDHWFSVRGSEIAYLIDGDEGTVQGTLTLSMFSPALEPHLAAGRIYSYGSFYTRTFYGDRTDVVLIFDLDSALPIKEIEIPPKSAGIGHSGMIGLIEDRFIGVWNITPAMSVSVVDTADERFVGEISTPGCAGVYPVDAGFIMACGDGRVQYVRLDSVGEEVDRLRSEVFFSVTDDPVFDYAVPTPEGWMFMSLEGHVYEVAVKDGAVNVSEPWSINPADEEDAADINGVPIDPDDNWRISGRQAFAYNAEANLLVTLMHEGGGQETFEDPGTQVWAFSTKTQRRAYVLELDEETKGVSVELTADEEPLLIIAPAKGGELLIHDGVSSRLLRTMPEIKANLVQRLE
ncbi:MAG: methylamine dehydrogenase heavy chain [Glaciecola sp.]|jgi:methylamine dehydrogenase heavy chain|uniref:amine dehydrogenase large subunit n=2 Tax=Congregibacter sp. TaxID=2744308 RepID=UPI0039E46116